MPFDLYTCYPRASLAASQAAYRRAVANEQLDHSDLALPASNVPPRLTTAEALTEVLHNSARGKPADDLAAWEVLEVETKPHRKYEAHFHYANGSLRVFA